MRATPVRDALRHVFRNCSALYDDNVVCAPRRKVFWGWGLRGFRLDRYNSGTKTRRKL
jgi:hypothetical protein